MSTPHNSANPGDFAKTVLMPGDPLRAEYIAKNFLKSCILVNNVRGIHGYTGEYLGKKVSVMASGMGMPSIGIYSYELYNYYEVENIIRIGSAGAMRDDINLRDVILAAGACTNSAFASQYNLPGSFAPIADFELLKKGEQEAKRMNINCRVGNILSSDTFYCDDADATSRWAKMGVLAVEMEAAALYMTAARCGKKALAICTVSDNVVTGESLTANDRQTTFTQMIELALNIA